MKWGSNRRTSSVRAFYGRHRRWFLVAGAIVGGILVLSIIFQLLYPASRTLPKQRIGGIVVGYKTAADLRSNLEATQKDMNVTLEIGDKKQSVAWQDIGITINKDAVVIDALNYPLWQKFVPFSAVYRSFAQNSALATQVDEPKLRTYTEQIAKDNYHGPANASLSITGTTVVKNAQKAGYKFEPDALVAQLSSAPYRKDATVVLASSAVPPAFSEKDIEAVAQHATAIINTEVKVDVTGKVTTIPAAEIAGWLTFTETTDEQRIAINTDPAKVKAYVTALGKEIYKAPGAMTITLRDGQELQRTPDTSGQSIDGDKGAAAVSTQLLTAKPGVVATPIMKLPPKITYQRSYTKSQAGMSALLNDIAGEEPDMALTVRAMDGSIAASAKGSKQYAPASTYKLMTVLSVMRRIEAGSMQWTDNVNGRNVEQCVSDMIVLSDNPCGTALGDKIGWQAITNDAQSIGMSRTNLARGFVSTTDDQAIFLAKLQQGTLVNPANQEKLLNLMKQQKYRAGIPAGTSGSIVANKVGFIDALLHDSAIVYGPKGTYALSIYSNKGSWPRMAAATAKVHALMSQ